jgi:hypothetical protein
MPPRVKPEIPGIPNSADIDTRRKEVIRVDVALRLERGVAEQSRQVGISNREEWLLAELAEEGYDVEIHAYGAYIWLAERPPPVPAPPSTGIAIIVSFFVFVVLAFLFGALDSLNRK